MASPCKRDMGMIFFRRFVGQPSGRVCSCARKRLLSIPPQHSAVNIIEDALKQPNRIAFPPDRKTLYLRDTGATPLEILQQYEMLGYMDYNIAGPHTEYAFDVSANGKFIRNKRPIGLSKQWIPDGLKAARNGYPLAGRGGRADVLDEDGTILVTVRTNYTAVEINRTGQNRNTVDCWSWKRERSDLEFARPSPVLYSKRKIAQDR
ncbi:hypothetical protein MMC15_002091 [Xylographa vitiligo]|nr:hypothetical protein [Xylographa vitiligo]